MAFNWTCPHCQRAQSVTDDAYRSTHWHINLQEVAEGRTGVSARAIACANPVCKKLTLAVVFHEDHFVNGSARRKPGGEVLFESQVYPRGSAKPQPDFIPGALREDYFEACLIREESPKASATLSRRCLQGVIRDFCGITRGRLIDEIEALKAAVTDGTAVRGVTEETVEAIDHVRGIGNIGAHMEKDIDLIVPVDPGEAQALIELIEMLFDEWYVARAKRQQTLARISAIGANKKQMIAEGRAARAAARSEADPEA
jgi:hypothetical protein